MILSSNGSMMKSISCSNSEHERFNSTARNWSMSMFPLITKYPSNGLHKLHIAKVGSNVEACFIGDTPRAKCLIRIRLRADNGSEEVHPPLCTLCLAIVDIEQAQRNLDIAHPQLIRLVELGRSAKPIGRRV
uniref:Uncharacterized protein n=1 Tax=Photinus pyralis TaxID=7054 RepID=A0A1Y1MK49_PHOPY